MPQQVYMQPPSGYVSYAYVCFSAYTCAGLPPPPQQADELISHVYYNIHKISVTGLRFFTVYGPWGRPDMAAYKFAVAIMKGEPIKIFQVAMHKKTHTMRTVYCVLCTVSEQQLSHPQGPEGQELKRDFTFIEDIASGVVGAVDAINPSGKDTAQYRVYNLGNTQPHTVSELVDILERALGKTAVRKYVPVPPTGDVLATFANVSAANKVCLGYVLLWATVSCCCGRLCLVVVGMDTYIHVPGLPGSGVQTSSVPGRGFAALCSVVSGILWARRHGGKGSASRLGMLVAGGCCH